MDLFTKTVITLATVAFIILIFFWQCSPQILCRDFSTVSIGGLLGLIIITVIIERKFIYAMSFYLKFGIRNTPMWSIYEILVTAGEIIVGWILIIALWQFEIFKDSNLFLTSLITGILVEIFILCLRYIVKPLLSNLLAKHHIFYQFNELLKRPPPLLPGKEYREQVKEGKIQKQTESKNIIYPSRHK